MAVDRPRIAVLSYQEPDAEESSYFTLLQRGLEAGLKRHGLETAGYWFPSQGLPPGCLESYDGLAVLGSFVPEEIRAAFSKDAVVYVNHSLPPVDCDSVHIHFEQAVELVIHHLQGLGHRKIAVIGGVEYLESITGNMVRHYRGEPRREAFVRLTKQRGIWSPSWVVDGDWSIRGGYEAMKRLLQVPDRPSAVFAANDLMAIGALRAIREAGLTVPGDFSLVGFDDLPAMAGEIPPLSSVRVRIDQIGLTAAGMLAERLAGRTATLHTQVGTELVVRASSAPPRHLG
jgi:LacI family transcriptional regulator